jgi:hypothetical protein
MKIGAHDINIVVAPHWANDEGSYGEWIKEDKTIYLKEGLQESLLFATLLHEAMHVMNSTLDHVVLDSLAEQISQFLWENGFLDQE